MTTQLTALQVLDSEFASRKLELTAALPANISPEKFMRIVKTASIQTPALLSADRGSLFLSCFKCAQDGLLPDGREAALVVYKIKQNDGSYKKLVQYMPMVGGILKKIRNSGELSTISAHVVYASDEFDYCLGDDEYIKHKPNLNRSKNDKPIAAYAIAKTKSDGIYREVMSVASVENIRNMSKAKDSSAWVENWDEMARKTVLRRLSKRLPMSSDVEDVIRRDDELFEFNNHIQSTIPNAITTNAATTLNNLIELDETIAPVIDISQEEIQEIDDKKIEKDANLIDNIKVLFKRVEPHLSEEQKISYQSAIDNNFHGVTTIAIAKAKNQLSKIEKSL